MEATRQAIKRRYALLPYWYALFREHALTTPPMRPLWFEFPKNRNFLIIKRHEWLCYLFFWDTRWYEWENGVERQAGSLYVNVPITHIAVFQRGGTIVPTWQRIRRASGLMIQNPLTVFVALDRNGYAKGSYYLDDGGAYKDNVFLYAEVIYKADSAIEAVINDGPTPDSEKYETEAWIERIVVRGLERTPSSVSIRSCDPTAKLEFSYECDRRTLVIRKPIVSVTQSYKINLKF